MRRIVLLIGILLIASKAIAGVVDTVEVDKVWSGHPVGFALLTQGSTQYVAYYNADRQMVVASRQVSSHEWTKKALDTSVKWDSHNYIAMAIDDEGQLHVAGNMHAVPLVYFRTTRAGDVKSLERVGRMVEQGVEAKCTYPRFFRGPGGAFLFTYRSGRSGDGDQIYNVYDAGTKTWRHLTEKPLTNGEGKRNAYLAGPTLGPDGFYHLVWVWRESPDCSSNHDLSYARSRDLVHWEKADGTGLELPMTLTNADVVDAVPQKGGIANGNTVIGFDAKKRVVISYHKYDEQGKTQIYNARFEEGKWVSRQVSEWDYRWEFGGGGSIHFEIGVGAVVWRGGHLTQSYRNDKLGSGVWELNEETLQPVKKKEVGSVSFLVEEEKRPVMEARAAGDQGKPEEKGVRYELRWETWGVHRDKAWPGAAPEPSVLRVVKIAG